MLCLLKMLWNIAKLGTGFSVSCKKLYLVKRSHGGKLSMSNVSMLHENVHEQKSEIPEWKILHPRHRK